MKFLLWGLIIAAIVLWVLRAKKSVGSDNSAGPGSGAQSGETMVACAHCGVHLPASEAVPGPAGVYCSSEHRRLAERG